MDELRAATTEELTERNIALGAERDRILDARRVIGAELDRRAAIDRNARAIVALPDELQTNALAGADPELIARVGELRLEQHLPATQTVEPEGIESAEAVGTPGRRRRRGRWG